MSTKNPEAENIFHKSADGAGFGRLRKAQKDRETFADICSRTHPSGKLYIDQVREYAGAQIVFYRVQSPTIEQARCAVFRWHNPTSSKPGEWRKENDIIVAIQQ